MVVLLVHQLYRFENAFDSVSRSVLWRLLRHYGMPDKIVTNNQDQAESLSVKCEGELLYGSETWRLTKGLEQKLQGFINKSLRLRIWWPRKISNKELWRQTG